MTILWHPIKNLLPAVIFFMAPLASTAQDQLLQSISNAAIKAGTLNAQQSGYENVKVSVRALDSRLKLPACNIPLSTFIPPPASKILGARSIGVRCTGQKPWTIYVRTNIAAQKEIPTLSNPMPRHSLITKHDIKMTNMTLQQANQAIFTRPDQLIGMETTRRLPAGAPLKANDIQAPKVIKRGQLVTLISKQNNLEVRGQGKALQDARAGDRLITTNLSSGKQVTGIANTDGTINVQ